MAAYAPIHPERPLRRAFAALAISAGIHAAAFGVLVLWALAVAEAARKIEEARPKEVALATVDAARWEANRRVAERTLEATPRAQPAAPAPAQRGERAMIAPGSEPDPRKLSDGAAGERGGPQVRPKAPPPGGAAPAIGEGPGPATGPGSALDLAPRAQPIRPLAMRFDPVGAGQGALGDGTSFGGLTVQTPEAWRFTNFFGRAVEAMNSVYRYELGAPMPLDLRELIVSHRAREACSFTSVRMDRSGKVLEASVRRSSGLPDVDALIIEVIRRTAPFVNVPDGLSDAGGIYADTWGLCIGIRG
jgi:hypothetical protein